MIVEFSAKNFEPTKTVGPKGEKTYLGTLDSVTQKYRVKNERLTRSSETKTRILINDTVGRFGEQIIILVDKVDQISTKFRPNNDQIFDRI